MLRAMSTMFVAPDCLMSSLVTAATENGTSCRVVVRFCADTTISSLISSSVGLDGDGVCAQMAKGAPINSAAAQREIPVFMRPLLCLSGERSKGDQAPRSPHLLGVSIHAPQGDEK